METIRIELEASAGVTGLLMHPADARACFAFAHGAGAGMAHPFMEAAATGLFERGIATLRYQFPYMENGLKRPDPPKIAQAIDRDAPQPAPKRTDPGLLLELRQQLRGPL